jgi:Prolyl oligopeptidase family
MGTSSPRASPGRSVCPGRLGNGGWSHGGFLAAWAVGQTGRFKGVLMGAGISDWGILAPSRVTMGRSKRPSPAARRGMAQGRIGTTGSARSRTPHESGPRC